MRTEQEDEDFQDPEADREWLEGSLSEFQQEGYVQNACNCRANQSRRSGENLIRVSSVKIRGQKNYENQT
jgi:hypothetical protein